MTNSLKMKEWIESHPTEVIVLGGVMLVLVTGSLIIITKQNALLAEKELIIKNINVDRMNLARQCNQYVKENTRLHELIRAKDAFHNKMSSELLRRGSPLGGQEMVNIREFYKHAS